MPSSILLHRLAALSLLLLLAVPARGQWINEIHYDNVGTDEGEAVEVVLPGDADPADFDLYLYNGSSGEPYPVGTSYNLEVDFEVGGTEGGFIFYYRVFPSNGIQNGSPDGLALAENGVLVPGQFLSYEGTFEAVDGPANGVASTDIGVSESNNTTPVGHSLHLTGTGNEYADFAWAGPDAASFGAVNDGQTFEPTNTAPVVSFASPIEQTVTEGTDASFDIAVQITNAGPDPVSVDVVLTGGDADAADFDGVMTRTVMFPPNAPDGSTETATFPLTDDEVDEGTETAVFSLQNVSGGPDATIGSPETYTLTIEDDDAVIPDLVINEIYANPTTDIQYDANNDGVGDSSDDEFIEIVNDGAEAVDLSGYRIEDSQGAGNNRVRHVFPEGTVLQPSQAIVVFGYGSPQGNFSGALVQVSTRGSLDLVNSGETLTLFDTADAVVASYAYGSAGSNNSSWTRAPDLSENWVRHCTTTCAEGRRFSPGTWVDGTPFGGGNEDAIVTVPKGDAGWRMLAPPVGGMTVDDLAAQNLVQGIPGQYGDGETDPNVLTYGASGFGAPASTSETLTPGRGFIWFLFDVRHEPNRPDGDSESFPLPFTLESVGDTATAEVTVDLHSTGDGWNLLGNPYNEGIDLDQMTADGDLVSSVGQVWDPNDRTYALTTDSPASGEVNTLAIWQAAFFQNDTATEVTFPIASKFGSGAPFYGRSVGDPVERRRIGFELAGPVLEDSTRASFDRAIVLYLDAGATDGWDRRDATKLTPLRSTYATLAFVGERGGAEVLKAQDSRPFEGSDFEVPLAFESVGVSGTFELTWPRWENVPDEWAFTLTDAETGQAVDLRTDTLYTFTASAVREAAPADPLAPPPVRSLRRSTEPRFTLAVERGSVDAEGEAAPLAFDLGAVHPNPTSGAATVRYALPEAADVRLVIYDVLGRAVATLADGPETAGRHAATLRTAGLASGVYVVQMRAGAFVASRRFVVVR